MTTSSRDPEQQLSYKNCVPHMDAYLESVAISVDNPAILLERNEDNLLRVLLPASLCQHGSPSPLDESL
ncbi:hypothetical protein PI124_g7758 [Phytophthora idaei]|nr:hypothetical protein PI125_g8494 [Phytophthora idaei]KAG3158948.1 hypothetical protein PI126_g7623 [Phytophthora idaei]KAG3247548.1 hypothetical protein PI124_g7758 [Phytophthora idaei]